MNEKIKHLNPMETSLADRENLRQELLKKFAEIREKSGVNNPDNLDYSDPIIREASHDHEQWIAENNKIDRKGDPKLYHKLQLQQSTFFVDAGFDDPDYLYDVIEQLQADNMEELEADSDKADLDDIKKQFSDRIEELSQRLEGNQK